MKKFGFTLAEVLITLAIIGVVAVLTLPALMNNVGEQQYITGFKKSLNTFTEAAQLSQSLTGYDYDTVRSVSNSTDTIHTVPTSVYGMLRDRLSIDETAVDEQKAPNQTDGYVAAGVQGQEGSGNFAIYLRDNTIIQFSKTPSTTDETAIGPDGHIKGIKALVDVNGVKGPNALSNCSGTASGATSDGGTMEACANNTTRMIKDQFSVLLKGNTAIPNGPAARWAALK